MQGLLIFLLLLAGGGYWAFAQNPVVASSIAASLVAFSLLLWISLKRKAEAARKQRYDFLMGRYRTQEVVDRIVAQEFWQGMSEEQLLESKGKPSGITQEVLKTKTKTVLKYDPTNRGHKLHITLVDGVVTGWKQY